MLHYKSVPDKTLNAVGSAVELHTRELEGLLGLLEAWNDEQGARCALALVLSILSTFPNSDNPAKMLNPNLHTLDQNRLRSVKAVQSLTVLARDDSWIDLRLIIKTAGRLSGLEKLKLEGYDEKSWDLCFDRPDSGLRQLYRNGTAPFKSHLSTRLECN